MSVDHIIRAWKDEEYFTGLSDADRAEVPANPAGSVATAVLERHEVSAGTLRFCSVFPVCPSYQPVCRTGSDE
jgi:mersacidin/lichenicidin family type 2 lantibiotic